MDDRGFETGWVIELGESAPSRPSYWIGPSENPAFWPFGMFSDDNAKAVRFARKEDAEAVVKFTKMWSHDDPRCVFRVSDHAWDCLPPLRSAQPQQADGRGAVIEALNMAKTYASSISDDWPEEMFAPTASDLGEALLVLAALQQSPATDNAGS